MKMYRILFAVVPLLLMAACIGGNSEISVFVSAEFEKRPITPTGLSSGEYRPARYCWVEGFDPQTGHIYFSGYLGPRGDGIANVPQGANLQVRLFAAYEVPGNNSGNFQMRGSVKNGSILDMYNNISAFNDIPDWFVLSEQFYTGTQDLTINIRALHSTWNREAGAFNIADQAVEFASKIADLEPGLDLPNLHSFWSPNNQYTNYPRVAYDRQNRILAQQSTD
ncbi:MAG: hypothetical protein LBH03_04615, partial [Holophagales bacterium]|nr:hypothetical protein [Holophagales bacterium]